MDSLTGMMSSAMGESISVGVIRRHWIESSGGTCQCLSLGSCMEICPPRLEVAHSQGSGHGAIKLG